MDIIDIEYSDDSYKLRAKEELVRTRIVKILEKVEKRCRVIYFFCQ